MNRREFMQVIAAVAPFGLTRLGFTQTKSDDSGYFRSAGHIVSTADVHHITEIMYIGPVLASVAFWAVSPNGAQRLLWSTVIIQTNTTAHANALECGLPSLQPGEMLEMVSTRNETLAMCRLVSVSPDPLGIDSIVNAMAPLTGTIVFGGIAA